MNRIPQNLRECAVGMFNASMTTNAFAINIGCFTHAILQLRHCFQATRPMEDRPRSGCLHIMMSGQDHYIQNIHLPNLIQTATATAANTPGTYDNRISAKTVRNPLRKGGLSACRPCLLCFGASSLRESC